MGNSYENISSFLVILAKLVAQKPMEVAALLESYGFHVGYPISANRLQKQLLFAIERSNGSSFPRDLATLVGDELPFGFDGYDREYDHFIEAISGAVSSIGNTVTNFKTKRRVQVESSGRTTAAILAQKAEKERLKAKQNAENTKQTTLLKVGGFICLVGLFGWFMLKQPKPEAA